MITADLTAEAVDLEELRALPWAHRAGPYQALDDAFDVFLPEPDLAGPVEEAFSSLATDRAPAGTYHVVPVDGRRMGRYGVFRDGHRLIEPGPREQVLEHLFWQANHEAILRAEGRLLLHSGVVAGASGAVLLPGGMGSGKSTLSAALARAGLAYLSDEVATIDVDTLHVAPYPKAIALTASAQRELGLAGDANASDPAQPRSGKGKRYFAPDRLGIEPATRPCPVGLVVAPKYVPGGRTELEVMAPAEAVAWLGEHAFNLRAVSRSGLEALAGICTRAPAYRLVTGRLDDARSTVLELLEEHGRA